MGSDDGAKNWELIDLLNHLEKPFGKEISVYMQRRRFGNHQKQVSTFGRQNKKTP